MRRLVASGRRVRVVNRSGRATVPAGVEVVAADVSDPDSARRACTGAAAVFHCASGPYGRWSQTLPPIMEGIIAGASSAGARLVYGDNLYAYGPVKGPLTEELPYRPVGPNTAVRAALATRLMDAHARGTVRATIGRASDFFGPQVHLSTVGDQVFGSALKGRAAQVLGDPDAPHTFTFIDDFAAGLITLATHDESLGQVWHVPSAETVTIRRFVQMVFQRAGKPLRLTRVPRIAVFLLAIFSPTLQGVKEVLYQSSAPWVVDHSKFARAFGVATTPHSEAIAQTMEWFRQQ